jgi:hypothetical protein
MEANHQIYAGTPKIRMAFSIWPRTATARGYL